MARFNEKKGRTSTANLMKKHSKPEPEDEKKVVRSWSRAFYDLMGGTGGGAQRQKFIPVYITRKHVDTTGG